MDPVTVDAVLLRGALPDLRIRVGATLTARVLERTERHGLLALGGSVLVAELPDDVPAGERLRLGVQEVSAERVVLRVLPPPEAPVPVPGVAVPLPGGGEARVVVAERDAGGGGAEEGERAASVLVHLDSPRLGRLELRVAVTAGTVHAAVRARAGAPHELVAAEAGALRAALARALDRPADVQVAPRRDPVDVRA